MPPTLTEALSAELRKQRQPAEALQVLNLDQKCRATNLQDLGQFRNLIELSLASINLVSLANFPSLPKLERLLLSDNRISGGLEALTAANLHQLQELDLCNNKIPSVATLEPLAGLERLAVLHVEANPFGRVTNKVFLQLFKMLATLQYLDNQDCFGNERPVFDEDDSDEEEVDADEEDDVVDEDPEDDDDDDDAGEGEETYEQGGGGAGAGGGAGGAQQGNFGGNDDDEDDDDDDEDDVDVEDPDDFSDEEDDDEEEGNEEVTPPQFGTAFLAGQTHIEDDEEDYESNEEAQASEDEDDEDDDEEDDGGTGSVGMSTFERNQLKRKREEYDAEEADEEDDDEDDEED